MVNNDCMPQAVVVNWWLENGNIPMVRSITRFSNLAFESHGPAAGCWDTQCAQVKHHDICHERGHLWPKERENPMTKAPTLQIQYAGHLARSSTDKQPWPFKTETLETLPSTGWWAHLVPWWVAMGSRLMAKRCWTLQWVRCWFWCYFAYKHIKPIPSKN